MQNILYKTAVLLMLCCVFSSNPLWAQLANVNYTVQVDRVIGNENPTSGDCWETGDEEYSAYVFARDNINGTETSSGCLTCDANGDCTYGVGVGLHTRNNTQAYTVTGRVDAWEDDRGDRCIYEGSCFICNSDDCRRQETLSYSFREQSTPSNGTFTSGPLWGSTANHQWQLRVAWNYVGTSNLLTPSCSPQSANYSSGAIRSWSLNLTAGVTYNFTTCGTSTEDTYIRMYGSNGHTMVASNDDACSLQSNLNFTPGSTGTYYLELANFSRDPLSNNGSLTYSIAAPTASSNGGDLTACPGVASAGLGGSAPAIGTGTWSSSSPTVTFNNVNVANTTAVGTTAGTYTLTWTIDNGGCTDASSLTYTVNSNSVAPTSITGNTNICQGDNTTLTLSGGSASTGAVATWYSSSCGGTAEGTGNSITVSPASTTTYYVRFEGGCNTTSCAAATVNVLPASVASSTDTDVCPGSSATLVATGAGAISFNWYATNISTTPLQSGSSVFTTPPITAAITYYVSAVNAGGCEGPRAPVNVGVLSAPAPTFTGTTTICSGGNTTLTATAAGSTGFNWYQNSDKTGFLQNGASLTSLPLNFTTTFYVAATYPNGCESLLTPITVTVNQLPPSPVANGGNYCENEDVIVTAFGTGGTINWYDAANGGTLLSTGSSYNTGTQTAGSYVFYAEEDDGSCQSLRTAVLAVVNPAPPAPAVNSPTICEGEQATLIATPTTGTIEWYADAAMTNLLATGSSYTTTILSATTNYYVVEVSNVGCRSITATATATVNPAAATPTVSGASICANSTTTLTATNLGGTTNWYADAATSILVGTGTSFTTPALVQNTTYYVQETSAAGCNSAIATATVTVNPLPAMPSSSPVIVCEGEDAILNATGSGSGDLVFYDNTQTEIGRTTMSVAVPNASLNAGALTAGNYVYYVGEDDGSCVSILATIGVSVNTTPAAPTATGATICSGSVATLTATGTGIEWYADAALTNLVAIGNAFNTGALTTTTDYYVTQSNANGCQSTATMITATVNLNPVNPVGTGTTICAGSSATLSASGGTGVLSWYIDATATQLAAIGTTYNTTVLQQTTTYYVQEVDANGCASGVVAVTAIVNPLPNTPAASNPVVCEGDDVILSASGSGSGDLVFYDATMVEISRTTMSMANPNASFNAGALVAGSYNYFVREDNGSCLSSVVTIGVTVNATPIAPITTTDTVCAGSMATLTATGSGTIGWYADAALSSQLGLGNVFSTNALNANTSYWAASTDVNGCISLAAQVDVVVNPAPIAPTAANDTVCAGNAASLTATGSGGTLNWYSDAAGMNQIATGATLNIPTIAQSATYYVGEINANGCMSMTTAVQVVVNPAPTAPAAAAIDACDGDVVTLSATGSGTGDIVFYDNTGTEIGRGTMGASNTITFPLGTLAAGMYNYFVAEEQGSGCSSAQVAINVEVQATPAAPTALNDSPVCEGEDVFLQATTVVGGVYNWTGPNGFSSTNQDMMLNNVSATNAGTYSVSVMVNGCSSPTATTDVVVNAKPVAGILTNNGPLCEGETLVVSTTTQAGVDYNWTGPNGFTANQASVSIPDVTEVDDQGFYTLTVEDQTTACVSDPVSTLVIVNKLPDPGMAFSNSPLCVGETLELSVPVVFGASYSWVGPNGFSSADRTPNILNIDADAAGVYSVEVTIDSCTTLLEVDVVIDTIPNTTVIPDTTVSQGDEIVLYATGGITYQWGPADYLSGVATPTPVFANAPVGAYTYSVDITAANGCTAQEKVTVTVETRTDIIITDLFTPNGDGVNDTWVIEFLDNVEPYTMQVFSRGGLEVYRSENYASDWDGTQMNSGKNLPDGTYYYLIRTQFREYTGAVTIKR